jgi:phosphohistidine swiveling domain-containing protein
MDVIKECKKLTWIFWLERFYLPFVITIGYAGVDKKYFDRVGLKGFGFGYKANLHQSPDLYQSRELSLKNKKAMVKYLKNHSISDFSKKLDKAHKDNLKKIKKIIKSKDSPNKKLYQVQELLRLYFPFLWLVDPMEIYYAEKANKLVPKYVSADVKKWVGDVSIPKKKNVYVLLQDELRKNVPLEKVLAKYAWAKSRDGFSDFYTLGELQELKKHIKNTESPKIKVPKELKFLVDELKELTFFRTSRTDKYYEAMGAMRPIFREIAKYIGVSFEELGYYDAQSILLGKPVRVGLPYSFAYYNGHQVIRKEKIIEFGKEKVREVQGIIAFAGLAKGIVKIVKHPDEIGKVNAGDILVAQSTFPSYISAMHKAAAFVTDEGGITSHAAIIAREMKKPCIIGTKNATKVLKDGDMVEVDANKGIVKIIK